jgi:MurNAc alpha-1-phosphate uridylyltransferase
MFKHLVIFAAGNGSRMLPLTTYVSKAMVLSNGKTLIQTSIEKFKEENFKIHVTVGYKGSELSKHVISLGVNTVISTTGKGNAWWIYKPNSRTSTRTLRFCFFDGT